MEKKRETVSDTGWQNSLRTCPNSRWGKGTLHSANFSQNSWVGSSSHLRSAPVFSYVPLNISHWSCTIVLTAGGKRWTYTYLFAILTNIFKMYELGWCSHYLSMYWNRLGSSNFFKILVIVCVKKAFWRCLGDKERSFCFWGWKWYIVSFPYRKHCYYAHWKWHWSKQFEWMFLTWEIFRHYSHSLLLSSHSCFGCSLWALEIFYENVLEHFFFWELSFQGIAVLPESVPSPQWRGKQLDVSLAGSLCFFPRVNPPDGPGSTSRDINVLLSQALI